MKIGSLVKQGKCVGGRQLHNVIYCAENKVRTNFFTSDSDNHVAKDKWLFYDPQCTEQVVVVVFLSFYIAGSVVYILGIFSSCFVLYKKTEEKN